ncbi:hypothetical protein MMC25_002002 [Agyrium rufum]|nr:hypothetical protein [Agyrium rufum]
MVRCQVKLGWIRRAAELIERILIGPIIRITPDEIHIDDVGFLDTVFAPSKFFRDKYDYQLRSLRVQGGVGATKSHELHKKRRDALSPFFSKRNVLFLEPLILEKVEQLRRLIAKHAADKTIVNLSDVFFAFCNEYGSGMISKTLLMNLHSVVTNFLFAHHIDNLADEANAGALRNNSVNLLRGVHMNKHFPWIPSLFESLPSSVSKGMMPPGLVDLRALFDRVRAELLTIMENKKSGVSREASRGPTGKESVYDSVLDNPDLPPEEKSLSRLEQEGALLVLAGTESPSKSLGIIFYHLIDNPSMLKTLRTELMAVSTPTSWTQLEQLPYLSAIIEEGNRLSFGVTARTARIAYEALLYTPSSYAASPKKGQSYAIPPGTPISMTTWNLHTSESVFPDPLVFNPDRWLGDAGRERRKFHMAFGKGGRKCLGIELARAELFLVTATLVRSFDMTLWETEREDVAFLHDYQTATPKLGSKGVRVLTAMH